MKASELRIGNYITDEFYESFSTIIEVESINQKGINLLLEDDGKWAEISNRWIEPEYKFDELFGLPITEEWLLKFGFEKTQNSYKLEDYQIVDIYNGNTWLLEEFDYENICFVGIGKGMNYLHQLQNLYFALTGEELTFKSE